jgi:hypothetical protein
VRPGRLRHAGAQQRHQLVAVQVLRAADRVGDRAAVGAQGRDALGEDPQPDPEVLQGLVDGGAAGAPPSSPGATSEATKPPRKIPERAEAR